MALIQAEQLNVRYGRKPVLTNVNFRIDKGEIVTVVGPNGSGKTTFLRAMIGAVPALSGRIRFAADLAIGYVPQKLSIDPTLPLTVDRFLNLPVRRPDSDSKATLEKTGVSVLRWAMMSELSGGQFQRVLLARALLNRPDLLLLDEATQGQDQPGSASFYTLNEEILHDLN